MIKFAVVVPLANEADTFKEFTTQLAKVLDGLNGGTVFFVVDKVSKDNTLALCQELNHLDKRFITIWAPDNKNVVNAYLAGYQAAYQAGFDYIIEMDAGLSHDPSILPRFIEAFAEGYDCVFGSRYVVGGSNKDSVWFRRFLSRGGTLLSNALLGTKLHDMTSGYQGFSRSVVERFLNYRLHSTAHFYQTELRYLLRQYRSIEQPIRYQAPSPRVGKNSIINALGTLFYYFKQRLVGKAVIL